MVRQKSQSSPSDSEPQLDVSSLVDVCFLLLIYFLATSSILPSESDLPLSLPGPGEVSSDLVVEPMFIRVDAAGGIFTGREAGEMPLDQDPFSRELPLLKNQLSLYKAAPASTLQTPLVQIWVDPEATQQRVVDVLNVLTETEITNVTFTDLVDT